MKNDFTNDELEDFLKHQSDRLRLRPSDAVWKGISANLNKRRRMRWLTGSFLVITSLVAYFLSQTTERLSGPLATETAQAKGAKSRGSITSTNAAGTGTITTTLEVTPSKTKDLSNDNFTSKSTAQASKRPALSVAYKRPNLITPAALSTETEPAVAVEESPLSSYETTVIDSDPTAQPEELAITEMDVVAAEPLSIESVTNLQMALKKTRKMNVAFFFTPTVSYRKLSENKSYMNAVPIVSATPNYAALYNINDAVTHKPNIGLELGVAAKYPIGNNIRLQGGLQFNMSRYDVKAFSNYGSQPATLALRSGTQTQPTTYSNFNGANSDWLQNIYFQVSAPVGVEVKFGQPDKTQFGIASTIQPTYMLGDRVYLLSSDYKNYVEVPWLMRRWNVNTALSTFVSYTSGKLNWQVGPQVRYQMLSSFVSKYPVKEHLFDFGLKVGVSLNQK